VSGYFDDDGKVIQFGVAEVPEKGNAHVTSRPISQLSSHYLSDVGQALNYWGFGFVNDWGRYVCVVPDWFSVLVTATLVAAPWLRWRFSLRTLLIATTLVTVVLGLIVYATRQ
jgi:hypothetical protein